MDKSAESDGHGSIAAANEAGAANLDLAELQQTPGFMIRILQLDIFERFYRFFEKLRMTPIEYAILIIVRDNKNVTQSKLAAVLKMQLPNVVKILSKMESEGTLRRKRSNRDKRTVELSLTAPGHRRADEANSLGHSFNRETLAALTKREQTTFLQMLLRLLDADGSWTVRLGVGRSG